MRRSTLAGLGVALGSTALFGVAVVALGDLQTDVYLAGFLAFALIGAFLGVRRPQNPIGWIFSAIGSCSIIGLVAELPQIGALIPAPVQVTLGGLWFASFALLPALLILFPDGRVPSPRWRGAIWAIVLMLPVGVLVSVEPDEAAIAPLLSGFLGRETALSVITEAQAIVVLQVPFLILGFSALASRGRRADAAQRQQLKWMTFAGGLLTSVVAVLYVAYLTPLRALDPAALYPVAMFYGIPFTLALVSIPAAAAVAILRHRLYDIDVLINRTIVYGALTAVLGAAYVGSVLLLHTVLRPFTAGSDVAVAVSTLGVVALFQPLRRRIQNAVDRRFYRSRYDAERTVDAFAQRLRNEVDLAELQRDLVGVTAATLQPRHASLWLRKRP